MPYLLLFGSLLVLGLLTSNQRQAQKTAVVFVAALLFVFVAFRYRVGCDWLTYEYAFTTNIYLSFEEAISRREPGYWLATYFFQQLGLDYLAFNVFMAAIFFAGLITLARRQPNPVAFLVLSFPILIINMPMSAVRQAAAIGLLCIAFVAFSERRLVKYVGLVFAASLFHSSALFFLGLTPFIRYAVNRQSIAMAILLVLPGGYFLLFDVADFYADRYVDKGRDAEGAIYRTGMLFITAVVFLRALRPQFQKKFPHDYQLALLGAWLMLLTLPLVSVSTIVADRFAYYLTPIQLLILARISFLVRGPFAPTLAAGPFVALGVVLIIWTSYSSLFQRCYMPYQTWLFSSW